jgi:hypothetical protein
MEESNSLAPVHKPIIVQDKLLETRIYYCKQEFNTTFYCNFLWKC